MRYISLVGRKELLADVVEYARRCGIAEVSLRELAELVGSSHRMLLYHFGSREGLLAAIVGENEAREREIAASFGARTPRVDALRRSWTRLRDPAFAGDERLFFELAAMTMYARPGTERVSEDLMRRWIGAANRSGVDVAQLRLDVAVVRGLLLDLLITGDREGTDAAFERYLASPRQDPGFPDVPDGTIGR